jgi:hypothetical protein
VVIESPGTVTYPSKVLSVTVLMTWYRRDETTPIDEKESREDQVYTTVVKAALMRSTSSCGMSRNSSSLLFVPSKATTPCSTPVATMLGNVSVICTRVRRPCGSHI